MSWVAGWRAGSIGTARREASTDDSPLYDSGLVRSKSIKKISCW
jgi:hypothetical protein